MSTKPKRRKKYKPQFRPHYNSWDVLLTSSDAPLPEHKRQKYIAKINLALHNLASSENPTLESWNILSDCFNMLRMLVEGGAHPVRNQFGHITGSHWPGADGLPVLISDSGGLLLDAMQALKESAQRYHACGRLRFSGQGLHAMRSLLEDYSAAIEQLPERTMIMCHRQAEKAIAQVWHKAPPGVNIISV